MDRDPFVVFLHAIIRTLMSPTEARSQQRSDCPPPSSSSRFLHFPRLSPSSTTSYPDSSSPPTDTWITAGCRRSAWLHQRNSGRGSLERRCATGHPTRTGRLGPLPLFPETMAAGSKPRHVRCKWGGRKVDEIDREGQGRREKMA